jgi:hypothetical protein
MKTKPKRYLCPKCKEKYMHRGTTSQSGKVRWTCKTTVDGERTFCYQTTNPKAPYRGRNKIKDPDVQLNFPGEITSKRIVITWAQNATPIHKPFFHTLINYCKVNDAQLIVIPGRYKNPTSVWLDSQENAQWWDEETRLYLINQRLPIGKNLVLLGDIKTQPTAVRPLSGFESITHGESGILGHPKLQMEVIPTPHQKLPKILTTTGACTVSNYTDSKAGKKGDFHHVLGAVVIEQDGDHQFHLRHINANSRGVFCDLDTIYMQEATKPAGPYKALIFGDTHVRFTDRTTRPVHRPHGRSSNLPRGRAGRSAQS